MTKEGVIDLILTSASSCRTLFVLGSKYWCVPALSDTHILFMALNFYQLKHQTQNFPKISELKNVEEIFQNKKVNFESLCLDQ